jgi:hypothetical protein
MCISLVDAVVLARCCVLSEGFGRHDSMLRLYACSLADYDGTSWL